MVDVWGGHHTSSKTRALRILSTSPRWTGSSRALPYWLARPLGGRKSSPPQLRCRCLIAAMGGSADDARKALVTAGRPDLRPCPRAGLGASLHRAKVGRR